MLALQKMKLKGSDFSLSTIFYLLRTRKKTIIGNILNDVNHSKKHATSYGQRPYCSSQKDRKGILAKALYLKVLRFFYEMNVCLCWLVTEP